MNNGIHDGVPFEIMGGSKRGVQRGELVGGDAPALVNAHPLVCGVVLGIPLACPSGVARLTTFIFKG